MDDRLTKIHEGWLTMNLACCKSGLEAWITGVLLGRADWNKETPGHIYVQGDVIAIMGLYVDENVGGICFFDRAKVEKAFEELAPRDPSPDNPLPRDKDRICPRAGLFEEAEGILASAQIYPEWVARKGPRDSMPLAMSPTKTERLMERLRLAADKDQPAIFIILVKTPVEEGV